MQKLNLEAQKIMIERFERDNIIALATLENGVPCVRNVNAYYEDGAFYVITYALSNKMKQIEKNSKVAIAGDWFTAHGNGINLGYFCKNENKDIAEKLKKAFSTWIDNGHNNFDDENTCILCIKLTDGVLFSHGKRYDIDFTANLINSNCGLNCEQCEYKEHGDDGIRIENCRMLKTEPAKEAREGIVY